MIYHRYTKLLEQNKTERELNTIILADQSSKGEEDKYNKDDKVNSTFKHIRLPIGEMNN